MSMEPRTAGPHWPPRPVNMAELQPTQEPTVPELTELTRVVVALLDFIFCLDETHVANYAFENKEIHGFCFTTYAIVFMYS